MSTLKEQVMSMSTLPEVLARLYQDWKHGNHTDVLTLEELGEINKFMHYIDNIVDTHRVVDLKAVQGKFEELFKTILKQINSSNETFKLSLRETPVINASAASIHLNAQLVIQLDDNDLRPLYVPLNYNYENWRLVSKENLEAEILTTVSSSIIRSLKHDMKMTLINPKNFAKFKLHNLDVIDYFYSNEEVVLEISSLVGSDQVYLFYVWNVVEGAYKRKGPQSALAQLHLRNKNLAQKLQE